MAGGALTLSVGLSVCFLAPLPSPQQGSYPQGPEDPAPKLRGYEPGPWAPNGQERGAGERRAGRGLQSAGEGPREAREAGRARSASARGWV